MCRAVSWDDVSFPLTPALSPGEREIARPVVRQMEASRPGAAWEGSMIHDYLLRVIPLLPLPGGEGRGEGGRL